MKMFEETTGFRSPFGTTASSFHAGSVQAAKTHPPTAWKSALPGTYKHIIERRTGAEGCVHPVFCLGSARPKPGLQLLWDHFGDFYLKYWI